MGELHLAIWSLPELVVAIFAASVLLTSYLQPLDDKRERQASAAFRWIALAISLLMFSMFLQHSGLVRPDAAMWWTYLLATTLTPLGIRLARASGRKSWSGLEAVYGLASLLFAVGLLTRPQWFVQGVVHNPLGFVQADASGLATLLVLVQVSAVGFSSWRLNRSGRFGPMSGARVLSLMWITFGATAVLDQLILSFQLPLPPVFWLGSLLITIAFTRVIALHHQRLNRALQNASLERSQILEQIAQDRPLPEVLQAIAQLPAVGKAENQRLAQTAHDHHRLLRDLEFRAAHDPLTGLANRPHLARCIEALDDRQFALLVIDLNGFKRINDTLGHAAGDALLIEVTQRLSRPLPPEATLARFGGDEFVVLFPAAAGPEAARLAEQMTQALQEPVELMGLQMFASASIGISLADEHKSDLVSLHGQADIAMYYAKERGRAWMFYQPHMGQAVQQRLTLENALREAVEDRCSQFTLVYQPIVSLASREVVGVEVLLRWTSPNLGFVGPANFIHVAEESGLIVPLGEWVLRTACVQAARWQAHVGRPLSLCVNIAAEQFEQPNFVDLVRSALEESGLAAQCLTLEVVETVMMHRFDEVAERFAQLQALGIKIALDDFGTGFSSLNYLHRLPFDYLKIDRSFVQPLEGSPQAQALVGSIVHLAHALDKAVVVEGIETSGQQRLINALRCELGQGYLFSEPLPTNELEQFLERQQAQASWLKSARA